MSRKGQSSAGKLVQCIICILIGFAILGVAYHGWISPWIAHKDWVEVEMHMQYTDCTAGVCYGYRGSKYSCQKCNAEYEYVYNNQTFKGKLYYESPVEGNTKKVLINPKAPSDTQNHYDPPGVGLFVIMVFMALLAFGFAFMFGSSYRSNGMQEKTDRKNLAANGDDWEGNGDAYSSGNVSNRLGPPKPKYKR